VAINVVGSFLLGVLVVVPWCSTNTRTVLGVGLLGGFTTFSTFSAQTVLPIDAGEPGRAIVLVLASVVLGPGAAGAGYYLARAIA
jgi:CrcB protein